jgi:NADPH-dependent ferric siderophore reductase
MNDYTHYKSWGSPEQRLGRRIRKENETVGRVFTIAVVLLATFLLGFVVHAHIVLSALGY